MTLSHPGELAALGTAFCWTITSLAFQSAGQRIGSLSVNLIRLVIALGFLSLFCFFNRGLALPVDASMHAWIWLAASGVVGFTIGDLCLFRAFVVTGARVSMLLMAMVPPLTAALGWILLDEHLMPTDWIGMLLTVGGVLWVILERKKHTTEKSVRLPLTGILLGLGGAVGQAVGLVLSKFGMGEYDPFAATQIRVIAGIVSFGVLFVFIGWWPKVIKSLKNKPAMKSTSLGAFFGPFLGVSLSLMAVKYTQSGVASTIMSLVPVFIIIPSILIFKERVSLRAITGSVIAVSGCALLFL